MNPYTPPQDHDEPAIVRGKRPETRGLTIVDRIALLAAAILAAAVVFYAIDMAMRNF